MPFSKYKNNTINKTEVCIQNPNIIKLKKLITSKNSLQICKEINKGGCDAG